MKNLGYIILIGAFIFTCIEAYGVAISLMGMAVVLLTNKKWD